MGPGHEPVEVVAPDIIFTQQNDMVTRQTFYRLFVLLEIIRGAIGFAVGFIVNDVRFAAVDNLEFFEGRVPSIFLEYSESVHARLDAFLAKESIPYVKEGKKGPREVDLRKGIYDFAWNDAGKFLTMTLDASSGDNVKPFQVLEALLQERGEALSENALKITRLDVYARINASEEDPGDLIPMDEVGSVF